MKRTVVALVLAMSAIAPVAAMAVAQTPSATLAQQSRVTLAKQSARVLKSGNFMALEHPTQGTARIVMEGSQKILEFGNNFRSDSGPALRVVLHRSARPGMQLTEGQYVVLSALQKTSGSQRYVIPNNLNLAQYQSVAIWCQQFNATFGAATLN